MDILIFFVHIKFLFLEYVLSQWTWLSEYQFNPYFLLT